MEAGIHWLRVSVPGEWLVKVSRFLDDLYGERRELCGFHSYERSYRWGSGAAVWFDSNREFSERVHGGMCTVEVPGGACDVLGVEKLLGLVSFLSRLGGVPRRVDVFIDDVSRLVSPSDVLACARKGHLVGFLKGRPDTEERFAGGGIIIEKDAVSFGRRGSMGSGKYLRVYDKGLESEGENDSVRWEVEFSGDKAVAAWGVLLSGAGGEHLGLLRLGRFARACASLVVGAVEFMTRPGETHLDRRERLPWWVQFVGNVDGVKLRKIRVVRSIEDRLRWLRRVGAGVMGAGLRLWESERGGLREGVHEFRRWIWETVRIGLEKIKAEDQAEIDAADILVGEAPF